MKFRFLAALLLAPPLAWAQGPNPSAAKLLTPEANPDAVVPRVAYRSVFKDTPTGIEALSNDWKKANGEVGQFRRGHVDLLKWEQQQAGMAAPKAPAPAPPVSAPPLSAAPAAGHSHHGSKP